MSGGAARSQDTVLHTHQFGHSFCLPRCPWSSGSLSSIPTWRGPLLFRSRMAALLVADEKGRWSLSPRVLRLHRCTEQAAATDLRLTMPEESLLGRPGCASEACIQRVTEYS